MKCRDTQALTALTEVYQMEFDFPFKQRGQQVKISILHLLYFRLNKFKEFEPNSKHNFIY